MRESMASPLNARNSPSPILMRSQRSTIATAMMRNDSFCLASLRDLYSSSFTPSAATGYASSQPDGRRNMSRASTKRQTRQQAAPLRPMTDREVMAAALSDPDAQPLKRADFARMKRVPRAKIIRRALGLSQEEFAARYRIPLGTLRDWEQSRSQPDQTARAYLEVIAAEPNVTAHALDRSAA